MRIRLAIPDHLVTAGALEAALEATALANEASIRAGEVPSLTEAIKRGVRWKPEPFTDGEHFDLATQVLGRKWGDCDDLAPWLAGELRATGQDPDARPRVYETGPGRWHVVVETGDGRILDPSKWAGMGRKSSVSGAFGVCGAVDRPFARRDGGALCVVPHQGDWWARCDLPFPDGSGHMASKARANNPLNALNRAMAGAIACGEAIDSPLVDRARAAGTFLLSDVNQVGSLFGSLLKGVTSLAASAIPGGSTALNVLSKGASALSKGKAKQAGAPGVPAGVQKHPSGAVSVPLERKAPEGHDQHMLLYYHPERAPGPVIMRF